MWMPKKTTYKWYVVDILNGNKIEDNVTNGCQCQGQTMFLYNIIASLLLEMSTAELG